MSMCDNCIHDEVCGLEDNHEEAITFCANMIPKDIQEPFINKPCVSSEVCEHDKNKVLDKIRAEIEEKRDIYRHYNDDDNNIDYGVRSGLSIALKVIDKYIGDTE